MKIINMRSAALSIEAQGVGSCYSEQLRLVTEGLKGKYEVRVNSWFKSDITHYHTVNLDYYFERLIRRKHTAGIGYVHFLPETIDGSLKMPWIFRKIFYKYLLAFYNSMDYLVVVNPVVISKLVAHGVKRPKILYIPNFVSNDGFKADAKLRGKVRADMGFAEADFVVMGAGQLQTRKGVFDFVETARLMPDVKFVWAGGFCFGKMSDGYDEINELMTRLPDNIKFLGVIPRGDMAGLYNACDLFFLPSFDELFPMTILEAAACAKPILLRDLVLYKDILKDYYLRAENNKGFAGVINKLRAEPQTRAMYSAKSLECNEHYSETSILNMWERLYDEACLLKQAASVTAQPNLQEKGLGK